MTTLYVVDTSYLLEYANCDDFCIPKAVKEVRKRFEREASRGARFFVPLPCIFELGNHIADVKHAKRRAELAGWLLKVVEGSLKNSRPWHITPADQPDKVLPALMELFVPLATKSSIGLVDTFTIAEANRLKKNYPLPKLKVHIWTNDYALKGQEPDKEHDPYRWNSDGTQQ